MCSVRYVIPRSLAINHSVELYSQNSSGLGVFCEINATNIGFGIQRNIERSCVFRWIRVLLFCGSVNIHPYLGMRDVLVWVHYEISPLWTRLVFIFFLSIFNRSMFCFWVSFRAGCHHKVKNISFCQHGAHSPAMPWSEKIQVTAVLMKTNVDYLVKDCLIENILQILKILARLDAFLVFNRLH